MRESCLRLIGAAAAAAGMAAVASAQTCGLDWEEVGGGTQSSPPFTPALTALDVWDDGTGSALYLAGGFDQVGEAIVGHIAKWDGESFSPVGFGMNWFIYDLVGYDDGILGPQLYAVGGFTDADGIVANKVARWDGELWWNVGGGMPIRGEEVFSAAVFDDGLGDHPALYVGGRFTDVEGQPINRLARWDGVSWSAVGLNDINLEVWKLLVFDDGTGPALYVGGDLDIAGGVAVNNIARWDGQHWSALGAGVIGDSPNGLANGHVTAMAIFDDGTGPALYVGGEFHTAGGQPASNVAKWDGTSWSPLGSGVDGNVSALYVYDDGSGPALYAGGLFTRAGGQRIDSIARWDGQAWSPVGDGITNADLTPANIAALAAYDGALYAGGAFDTADGAPADYIARWICNPVGACCMPSGECEMVTEQRCATSGGTYNGDGVECGSVPPCPQPTTGACCLPTGCQVMWEGGCAELGGLYQGDNTLCGDCPAFAAGEVEPNNRKLDANTVVLANGESLAGLTTGAEGHGDPDSPDYFLVQTPPAPLGIYRHELALTNPTTPGNVPSLRYQGQENTPGMWPCDLGTPSTIFGDDTVGTFATTEPDGAAAVTWYGFGREEQVYYRVDGTETTTDPYLATLETTAITPTDLGAFQPGEITIQTPDTADYVDTVLCVFDENLDPIPGYFNDNATVAGGAPADSFDASFLRRTYEPGTYYMAISIGDIVTELGVPCDSDAFAPIAYEMTDFPNVVFGFTPSFFFGQTDVSFSITDAAGTTTVPAARAAGNDLAWFTFTVGASCPADLDGSGAVDVFDLLNYLDLWFTADPGAERTEDEPAAIDVFDLLAYLDSWFAGC